MRPNGWRWIRSPAWAVPGWSRRDRRRTSARSRRAPEPPPRSGPGTERHHDRPPGLAYDTGFHYPRFREQERRVDLVSDRMGIADRFLSARRAAGGLAAYPGVFPATLDEAYAIQDEAIALWDRPVIGWKVGRINPPLADHFGADRLAGPIFDCRRVAGAGEMPEMPVFAEGFAAGEAEFLLRV